MRTPLDPAEALLAITGVGPAVGDPMPKITMAMLHEAADVQKTIRKSAKLLAFGETVKYRIPARSYKWTKLHDNLSVPMTEKALDAVHDAFPPIAQSIDGDYQTLLQNVHQHLADMFPIQVHKGFLGDKYVEPDSLSTFGFYNQLNLLMKPLEIFSLIGSAALLRSQVKPMRDLFPTLTEEIDQEIWNALGEAALVASYELPSRVQQGLGVWFDRRTVQYDPNRGEPAPAPPIKVSSNPDKSTAVEKSTTT